MKTQSLGSLVKRGQNFYCMWRSGGKQFCKVLRDDNGAPCSDRREAEKAKTRLMGLFAKQNEKETLERIQARLSNVNGDIEALTPGMSFGHAWTAFVKPTSGRKACEASTLAAYGNLWAQFETWIKDAHPEVKTLHEVTRQIAKGYLDSLIDRKVSNRTFNVHLTFFRYFFKVLRKDEASKLRENVWLDFETLHMVRESRRELTIEELKKVCLAAKGEMKTLFCIGLYTGLRLGDAATLEWSEVDLQRNLITLIPNKIRRKKGLKGQVKIAIHPVLLNVLMGLAGDKTKGYVLPEYSSLYLNDRRSQITSKIQAHFEGCGIKTKRANENGCRQVVEVGFHSLRHSFVSMCAMNNVAMPVVQAIVGHATVAMTEHYSHSNRLAEQQAVHSLPSIAMN